VRGKLGQKEALFGTIEITKRDDKKTKERNLTKKRNKMSTGKTPRAIRGTLPKPGINQQESTEKIKNNPNRRTYEQRVLVLKEKKHKTSSGAACQL